MASSQTRKRKAYTIAEKLHIVDRVRNGETQAKVSQAAICTMEDDRLFHKAVGSRQHV